MKCKGEYKYKNRLSEPIECNRKLKCKHHTLKTAQRVVPISGSEDMCDNFMDPFKNPPVVKIEEEKINIFKEDNDLASSDAANEMFEKAYKKYWGERIKSIELGEQGACASQFAGIDKIIHFNDVTIDEKVRRLDQKWSDILLEHISNNTTMTPGWIEKDLKCDIIAYGFLSTGMVHIFQFKKLKSVWDDNKVEWKKRYKEVEAENEGYATISCAVPTDVLHKEMGSLAVKIDTNNHESKEKCDHKWFAQNLAPSKCCKCGKLSDYNPMIKLRKR